MQELDSQRIEEFEFTPEQAKELLLNYQLNILGDLENLLRLHQAGESEELVAKLHAFKGMLSLFAKDSLVQEVVKIEHEIQAHPMSPSHELKSRLLGLELRVMQLHKEVQSYLESLA